VLDVQIEMKFVGWRRRGGERLGEVTEEQEKKVQGEEMTTGRGISRR
jgi:hypothetical protein